jgi:hypothetical protein
MIIENCPRTLDGFIRRSKVENSSIAVIWNLKKEWGHSI